MALEVTSENFEAEVLKSSLPVVVDAYANWCGPCQQMMPIFDELSQELADQVKLVKLNIDNERELAVQHKVSSIPTLIFFKDGKAVGKETGYMSKDVLKSKIENHLQ